MLIALVHSHIGLQEIMLIALVHSHIGLQEIMHNALVHSHIDFKEILHNALVHSHIDFKEIREAVRLRQWLFYLLFLSHVPRCFISHLFQAYQAASTTHGLYPYLIHQVLSISGCKHHAWPVYLYIWHTRLQAPRMA